MIDSDLDAFGTCAAAMADALKQALAPDTIRLWFADLSDCQLASLQAAALRWRRTERWLPKPVEWRALAHQVELEQLHAAITPLRDEPWHYEHSDCGDTGWLERTCRPGARCGCLLYAKHPTHEHSYVVACPCRATNTTYRKRRHLPLTPISSDEAEQLTATVRRRR